MATRPFVEKLFEVTMTESERLAALVALQIRIDYLRGRCKDDPDYQDWHDSLERATAAQKALQKNA